MRARRDRGLPRNPLWGRLVLALADAPDGLDADALIAAGWPDERMVARSGANRLHKTLSQLRGAGLADHLERRGERYVLAPEAPRRRVPERGWSGDALRAVMR